MLFAPDQAEIQAAYDDISKEGENARLTMELSLLMMTHPLLKAAVVAKKDLFLALLSGDSPDYAKSRRSDELKEILEQVAAAGHSAREVLLGGAISSLTSYGMNLGLRVGEARRDGLRSRAQIENLIAHMEGGSCTPDPLCARDVVQVLRWVLGAEAEPVAPPAPLLEVAPKIATRFPEANIAVILSRVNDNQSFLEVKFQGGKHISISMDGDRFALFLVSDGTRPAEPATIANDGAEVVSQIQQLIEGAPTVQ